MKMSRIGFMSKPIMEEGGMSVTPFLWFGGRGGWEDGKMGGWEEDEDGRMGG